jgi:hypothetical protein
MSHPFDTVGYEAQSESECREIVLRLIVWSQWFEVTPMPDDKWDIAVKPENTHAFPLSALLERRWAVRGST